MKKLSIIFSILFLLLFLNTQTASAASIPIIPSNAANCLLPRDPTNCNYEGVDYSNCQNGPIIVEGSYCTEAPPNNLCSGAGDNPPWTFYYNATCVGTRITVGNITRCDFSYAWEQLTCNAADRCEDPSIGNLPGYSGGGGGSGSNTSGHVLYGYCNAGAYDGSNPISACVSGSWYKQCCSTGGYLPTTYCSNGVCPAGQITAAGITTCDAVPPPPSRCPPGVQPGQSCGTCTTQTCPTTGAACATGNDYCVYDPTNGNYCGGCSVEVNTCSSCTST